MNKLMIFVNLTISFFLITSITANTQQQSCVESICGRRNGYLTIRFPFRLANIQPESCGYPGFDLFCDDSNKTLLHLPNSGNFSVQTIDYETQKIMVSDPDNCFPRRLLSGLDFSHSPFRFEEENYFENYTFYNCSEKNENYTSFERESKIGCLSTVPNFAIIGKDPDYFASLYESWCEVITNVRVPFDLFSELSYLRPQLLLAWDKPSCGLCEGNITRCAFKRDTSTITLETTCIAFDPSIVKQVSNKARYALGFSVGLGVPAIVVIIFILYKKVIRSRRRPAADHDDGRTSDTNLQG